MKNIDKLELILKNRLHVAKAAKSIFNTPDGEVVLEFLMKEAGILKPKITADVNLLLVRQGQQQIVLSLIRILGMSETQIKQKIQESIQNELDMET